MKTCPKCFRPMADIYSSCRNTEACFRARLRRLTLPELRFILDASRFLSRDRRAAIERELASRQ